MAGQLSEVQELLTSIDGALVGLAEGLTAKGYRDENRLRPASREGSLAVNGMRDGDADRIIGHFNKGASTKKLRKVYVLKPTGDPQKPFKVKRYVDSTQDAIFNVLARQGVEGVLPKSDLPDDLATVDLTDLDITPLGMLDLEDGAEYVALYDALYDRHPTEEQLDTLEGWPRSVTADLENAGAERAVKHLQELGHVNVKRFCGAKKLRSSTAPNVAVEIVGAAIADNCALIIECKATLDSQAALQLGIQLEVISELVAKDVEAVLPFKGKPLLGALCGMRTTRNMTDYNSMMSICELKGYQIFLPNGNDLSPGDGCVVSPGAPSCALSATSCSARSVTAKSVRRQRLAAAKHLPCHTRVLAMGVPRKVPAPGLVPLAGHARIASPVGLRTQHI